MYAHFSRSVAVAFATLCAGHCLPTLERLWLPCTVRSQSAKGGGKAGGKGAAKTKTAPKRVLYDVIALTCARLLIICLCHVRCFARLALAFGAAQKPKAKSEKGAPKAKAAGKGKGAAKAGAAAKPKAKRKPKKRGSDDDDDDFDD